MSGVEAEGGGRSPRVGGRRLGRIGDADRDYAIGAGAADFARQTAQPCGNCHTDFLGLTPFGRRFKLGGYTLGGGDFRKTLLPLPPSGKVFPTVDDFRNVLVGSKDPKDAEASLRSYAAEQGAESKKPVGDSFAAVQRSSDPDQGWVPPIAVMLLSGYTRTQAPDPGWAPNVNHWKPNNNVGLAQASIFGAGAITDNIGYFAQLTYGGPGIGDPAGVWGWDNVDVRFADTAQIGGIDVLYGITAHNNPTVQDVWNTAPMWTVPYFTTQLGFTGPGATTIVDGPVGQRVVGVGGYLFLNDMVYLEATGYRTLGYTATRRLGADPLGGPGQLGGVAPYLRAAIEQKFGDHNLMVGAFATRFDVHPWSAIDPVVEPAVIGPNLVPATNRFTDLGLDTQYQYRGDDFWFILRGSYIQEWQRYDAGVASVGGENLIPANLTNKLNTVRAGGTFTYGGDNRIALTGQYFDTWGTADAGLYAGLNNPLGLPNTTGYMAEIAYIPFGVSRAKYWPWFNTRIGLQYYYYTRFDGDNIRPHDKNTLILYSTILF